VSDRLEECLRQWWGYDSFRPVQREAMTSVLKHRDSVVVLPTGGGKSLCFQAPAMVMEGMAVVVSPLIALMKDQVDGLRGLGIAAEAINSTLTTAERRRIAAAIRSDETRILYVTPERLVNERFIRFLQERRLSFIAVDEAHCISQWGHDFRPDYRNLGRLREVFPDVGIHAYTATATPQVRTDIAAQLGLQDPAFHTGSFDRPNLCYSVQVRDNLVAQVDEVLKRHEGASGIIYCIRRKDVDGLCLTLRQRGHHPLPYHAGLDDQTRKENQEAFIREQADLMIATVAFGMGIDKPNVRFVLHTGMPKSIEHYQQESGRAGRDGLESECILLHNGSDFGLWRSMLTKGDGEGVATAMGKLGQMYDYCTQPRCRHQALAHYFGEAGLTPPCGACDVCLGEVESHHESDIITRAVLEMVQGFDQKFGITYVARVLCGEKEERTRRFGHHRMEAFGALRRYGFNTVRDWCRQLINQGFLEEVGEYRVLYPAARGLDWLAGNEAAGPILNPARGENGIVQKKRAAKMTIARNHPAVHEALFDRLRVLRKDLAEEENVPPYVIFGDATLLALAAVRPDNLDGFSRIHGVGERKLEQYGEPFVAVIRDFAREEGLDLNQAVEDASFTKSPVSTKPKLSLSKIEALEMALAFFAAGKSIEAVSGEMGRAASTISGYLAELILANRIQDVSPWIDAATLERVHGAIAVHGCAKLKPLFEELEGTVDYDRIRIACAVYMFQQPAEDTPF